MTERIYYTDAYRSRFDAVVEAVEPRGEICAVVLDRTCFYPVSGGQPHDTGTLGGARVVEVTEREDGTIVHVVGGAGFEAGQHVQGVVDWSRRFDHMQQHTGQHLLSAAFDRLLRARTVGFHLGGVSSTIDLAPEMSADAIARAEAEANRVVWEDRAVVVRFEDAEDASQLALRKEPARGGRLRIIEVDGFDLSACGGTHVSRTGAVGMIAALSWERFRGGTRLEFVCGERALRSCRELRDAVSGSIKFLSVAPADLPAAIERAQADAKELKRTIRGYQERLAGHEAAALAAAGETVEGVTLVVDSVDGYDVQGLRSLAVAVAARPGHAAVLFSSSVPALVVVARAADVPAVDAGAVLRSLLGRFGGRGGGKGDLAQGGGLDAPVDEMIAAAREILAESRDKG
jgi:alanyl-tRNA synthetase